jgi:ADP-ribose pyrophosphatase YjhB (NUDIX family)
MIDHCQAIRTLQSVVRDPSGRLPEDVFLFLSQMTPLVNVDLLIRDPDRGYLLIWRDDKYYGAGWHVPGGIIRFKETAADRIRETARLELGAEVVFESNPVTIRELIEPVRDARGHFMALLYRCKLVSPPDLAREFVSGSPLPGQWCWHTAWPQDIIDLHRDFQSYFE